MFCGNYQTAKDTLFNTIHMAIQTGWSPEHHRVCWTWTSASELVLLGKIKEKVIIVVEQVLSDFVELPVSYCGWVASKLTDRFPCEKIMTLILAELESFWSTTAKTKHQERRIKSIKTELIKELQILDFTWRYNDEEKSTKEPRVHQRECRIARREKRM